MTVTTPSITLLYRALNQMKSVLSNIQPNQESLPTPCENWTVRQLINHVVHGLQQFAEMARGGEWQSSDEDIVGDDWMDAYRSAAAALSSIWETLETSPNQNPDEKIMGRLPLIVTELTIHSWDLAKATYQSTQLDPELAQAALDWTSQNLQPQYRGPDKAFDNEFPTPSDAPIYNRLAGFVGRDPH